MTAIHNIICGYINPIMVSGNVIARSSIKTIAYLGIERASNSAIVISPTPFSPTIAAIRN
ncbi:MAG: hypothetical protein LBC74_04875 [Planctomycetaceae bacterium]|nr:hypothetical protein [Planctomycetaceae bacterium]